MSLNPRARTARPKTERWKSTMRNWQYALVRSSFCFRLTGKVLVVRFGTRGLLAQPAGPYGDSSDTL